MFPAPRIRVQGLHANASILSAEEVTRVRLSARHASTRRPWSGRVATPNSRFRC